MNSIGRQIVVCLSALFLAEWVGAEAVAAAVRGDRAVQRCPGTPNCVSSRDPQSSHYIPPLEFGEPADQAWRQLRTALLQEPRTVVVAEGTWTLRAESTSLVFRFVDDLEFQLVPDEHIIDVRSASRVGYWDLGANRRRVERLRERFKALSSQR